MKILFVLFENHERKIRTLAKGLTLIADAIPRAELAAVLYPTKQIRTAVAELYAHVLTFCVRAKSWYEEGSLKHALHSFTHPVELDYADLIEDINCASQRIRVQAEAGGQAEQRDIHLLLERMEKQQRQMAARQQASDMTIQALQTKLQEYQTTIVASHVQTTSRLQDIQVSQILDYVSKTSYFDELKSLQACLQSKGRAKLRVSSRESVPVWQLPKVQAWNKKTTSCLLVAGADRKSMGGLQGFCTDVVQYLRQYELPVIWALCPPSMGSISPSKLTTLELFKSMAGQAVRLNSRRHNDSAMNLTCQQFRSAETENDWIAILGSIVCTMPLLYIVLDLNLLATSYRSLQADFTWPLAFETLFRELAGRGCRTIVKVVMIRAGIQHTPEERRSPANFCVSIGGSGRSVAAMRRNIPIRSTKGRNVARRNKLNFAVT